MNRYADIKIANSKLEFYTPEIVILAIYIIIGIPIFLKYTQHLFMFTILLLFGFLFFIIEHKTLLIFNKHSNTFFVGVKMLFVNKYAIKYQSSLSNIKYAQIAEESSYDSETGRYKKYYKLNIINNDGSVIEPYERSSSSYQEWQKKINQINEFLNSDEEFLIMSHAPFFFRLIFGIPITFFYFLVSLYIIFPEGLKPFVPFVFNVVNMYMKSKGYHLQ